MTKWIVQVGADRETAKPEYAEDAGYEFWGPFSTEEASTFAAMVRGQWEDLGQDDPQGFVYGQVSVVVHALRSREMPLHNAAAQSEATRLVANAVAAASNWHLAKEDREEG